MRIARLSRWYLARGSPAVLAGKKHTSTPASEPWTCKQPNFTPLTSAEKFSLVGRTPAWRGLKETSVPQARQRLLPLYKLPACCSESHKELPKGRSPDRKDRTHGSSSEPEDQHHVYNKCTMLRAFIRAAAISRAARTMQAPRVRRQALRLAVVQTCLQTEKACGGRLDLMANVCEICCRQRVSANVKQARRLCSKADSQRVAMQNLSTKSHQLDSRAQLSQLFCTDVPATSPFSVRCHVAELPVHHESWISKAIKKTLIILHYTILYYVML